jgi:hypothetical protein
VIDLVTVSEYTVGNERVLVPQRIDPERRPADVPEVQLGEVAATAGPDEFIATLTNLWAPARENAMHLVAWAQQLANEGFARVESTQGASQTMLRVFIPADSCLVVVFRTASNVGLAAFRTVFERRAPHALTALESGSPPVRLTAGGYIPVDERVLGLVAEAYREASRASK